jgi:hypothetical protein
MFPLMFPLMFNTRPIPDNDSPSAFDVATGTLRSGAAYCYKRLNGKGTEGNSEGRRQLRNSATPQLRNSATPQLRNSAHFLMHSHLAFSLFSQPFLCPGIKNATPSSRVQSKIWPRGPSEQNKSGLSSFDHGTRWR